MAILDFGNYPVDMRNDAAVNANALAAFEHSFDTHDEGGVSNEYWIGDGQSFDYIHVVQMFGSFGYGSGSNPPLNNGVVTGFDIYWNDFSDFRLGVGLSAPVDVFAVMTAVIGDNLHSLWANEPLLVFGSVSFGDVLVGSRFGDELLGYGGNDLLVGGGGHDILDGMAGNDTMRGGPGNDTYFVDSASDRVTEVAGQGTRDTVKSATGAKLAPEVERLQLVGTGAADGTGNTMDNRLTGNAGANELFGKGGDDVLLGGLGNDTLQGDNGADTLTGGDGRDVFVFATPGDADTLLDFVRIGDDLRFDNAAGAFEALPDVFGQGNLRRGDGFTTAANGNHLLIYDTASGNLYYDADANGPAAAVLVATLAGAPELSYLDIQVA